MYNVYVERGNKIFANSWDFYNPIAYFTAWIVKQ